MRVRIICYDDVNDWILRKFAIKMQEDLTKLNIFADIDIKPDINADINHHIIYNQYKVDQYAAGQYNVDSINTLMITHVDNLEKLNLLKQNLSAASLGICMSKETMYWLAQMGIDKNKLCYINPAHDGLVNVKKYVIGITCRVQSDGRKREWLIDALANEIDPRYFMFKIMGDSWDPQVKNLLEKGFEVEYIDHFVKDLYYPLISSLDFYLYTGLDEGQMGFVDAAAAGVKTIVTPQGYHLDAENGITYSFTSYEELREIFLSIQIERTQLVDSVATWNWEDYTKKHVELWTYLLSNKVSNSQYKDGLNSLFEMLKTDVKVDSDFIKRENLKLNKIGLSQKWFTVKNKIKSDGIFYFFSTVFKRVFALIKK